MFSNLFIAAAATQLNWPKWFPAAGELLWAGSTTAIIVAIGILLGILLRRILERHQLRRVFHLGVIAIAVYVGFHIFRLAATTPPPEIFVFWSHRVFVAAILLLGLRVLDGLAIVPLLTRGGKLPMPRFVHQIVVCVISIFVILGYCNWAFELNISNFLAGSAVLSIVLGLALQETLGNFFSGMVVQASSPFTLGDWIICADVEGRVVDMTWRNVTVLTNDGNFVLIPNSTIAKEKIINFHLPKMTTARSVTIGLDYNVAPARAREVLIAAAAATPGVLADPAPSASLADFGDSAIVYKVGFWINEPSRHGAIEQAVRVNIWNHVKAAGINIPYPMRTVEIVKSEGQEHKPNI